MSSSSYVSNLHETTIMLLLPAYAILQAFSTKYSLLYLSFHPQSLSSKMVKALSKQLDAGITAAAALSSTCVPAMPLLARTEYLKVVSTTAGLVGLGSAVARHANAMLQLMASGEKLHAWERQMSCVHNTRRELQEGCKM